MLIIDTVSLDSAEVSLGGEWYSGGQKERSRVAHTSLEYVWVSWSHRNSEHTLFPPSATHTSTNERRIVEFHGYGVVKWSDGCGWMALVSQQALLLHLSLCGHWQAHSDKYWCTEATSFLKINPVLRVDASMRVPVRQFPRSHQGKQRDARVKMCFNDLWKASANAGLMRQNVMKRSTRVGGGGQRYWHTGKQMAPKDKTIKI